MKEFWNERYLREEYAYGKEPNLFYKESLDKLNLKGNILLPAEGEGRNAVYAAGLGLQVSAFDFSSSGRDKALALADQIGVSIEYTVCDFLEADLSPQSFNSAALIYAHFPPPVSGKAYAKVSDALKQGGYLILEGFAKSNLPLRQQNPQIGGPDNLQMLFTIEEIAAGFPDFEQLYLKEEETELSEGQFHVGRGRVVRFIGRKKG